jgi:hypothetical protein
MVPSPASFNKPVILDNGPIVGGDVVDYRWVDVRFGRGGVERRRRGGLHRVGTYRVDQFLLQAKQVRRRLGCYAGQAYLALWDANVLERGQFPAGVIFLRQNLSGCSVHLRKIGGRDKRHEYRDVRVVRGAQRKALREVLQQNRIGGLDVTKSWSRRALARCRSPSPASYPLPYDPPLPSSGDASSHSND